MRIKVNGVRLFVDFSGPKWVPDGSAMRELPTLMVLHGGPGADHSLFKPLYAERLSDLCQIVYVDHRGNGRSDDGDPALWTLAQWGDDLAALCDALELNKVAVLGGSFGGFVAQSFATRHPDRLSGLVLANTAAKVDFETIFTAFERIGGAEAGAAARAYWSAPSLECRQHYAEICVPHYTRRPLPTEFWDRIIKKDPVAMAFNGPNNEMGRFDFRAALAVVTCPALVISGDMDPIMPDVFSTEIIDALGSPDKTLIRAEDAGHLTDNDRPDLFFPAIRQLLSKVSNP